MKEKSSPNPPAFLVKFLGWISPNHLIEGILCDLEEQFYDELEDRGVFRARLRFAWNAFRLIHPVILFKNHFYHRSTFTIMLKSHFVVTARNMMRNKFYSFINVLGLSFAIALAMLVVLFVRSEFSRDQFHKNKDSIYRIYTQRINLSSNEVTRTSATTSIPLSETFGEEFVQIVQNTRFGSNSGIVIKDNQPYDEVVNFFDPDFFTMFSFPVIKGNSEAPIKELNDVVLSEESAKKYFGDSNPIDQVIKINFNSKVKDYRVSAVVNSKSNESAMQFTMAVHIEQFRDVVGEETFNSPFYGLVDNLIQLTAGTEPANFETLLTESYNRGQDNSETTNKVFLQPIASVYLDTNVPGSLLTTSDPQNTYILMGLAILVLVIAVINFITLSTGHAMNRMKEIGVRKAIGAIKSQLRVQLIAEAFFISIIAGLVGVILAIVLIPYFNDLAGSALNFEFTLFEATLFVILILMISMFSGLMQAGLLVRIKASDAVRGKSISVKSGRSFLGKGLVILQFTLSIGLIIGTMIMRNQLTYLSELDLGYEKERLVQISTNNPGDEEASRQLLDRFRAAVGSNPSILSVAGTMNHPELPWTRLNFPQEGGDVEKLFYNQVDPYYLETMGMELVLGNDFNRTQTIENNIIVNEAMVRHFGWEDPLSAQIPGKNFKRSHKIVGVVKDFHFGSLKDKIEPLILSTSIKSIDDGVAGLSTYQWPPMFNQIVVKIGAGEIQPVIAYLDETWQAVNSGYPLLMTFVDDLLEAQYASETRWRKVIDSASGLAILIAWLGLLGLTRLSVQKRIKEIGVRKVLGSSIKDVILLLSRGILGLIIISNLLAWPIAWWLTNRWLENFAYKIDVSLITFGLVGLAVILFATGSVMVQVFRTAASNPIKALRYD